MSVLKVSLKPEGVIRPCFPRRSRVGRSPALALGALPPRQQNSAQRGRNVLILIPSDIRPSSAAWCAECVDKQLDDQDVAEKLTRTRRLNYPPPRRHDGATSSRPPKFTFSITTIRSSIS